MTPRLPLAVSALLCSALALFGCTGGDTSESAATTASTVTASTGDGGASSSTTRTRSSATTAKPATTKTSTTTTTSSVPTSSTKPAGECDTPAAVPATAVARTTYKADVDADGAADTVTAYAAKPGPGEGDWHVRVDFASGGGSDLTLPDDPAPGAIQVLGSAYIGSDVEPGVGGRRPALFVWTGSGASARTIGLYRVDGCELSVMTAPGGGPAGFVVGASVGHQEGLRCEGVAGTALLTEVLSESSIDGSSYSVTRRAYSRDGNALVVYGTPTDTTEPVPPAEGGQIQGCGDVAAPG